MKSSQTDTPPNAEWATDAASSEVRTLVADYARAHGVRDPDVLAGFSRQCVAIAHQSLEQRPDGEHDDPHGRLEREAVAIAMQHLSCSDGDAALGRLSRRDVAPAERPAAMPPQPLGELHPIVNPEKWVAVFQGVGATVRLSSDQQR
ncbi:hypothetical protein [Posidoniimonas polymericola]|uniref:hypothetical protein n=1 Tax=Posidoniimonas polymericola TaxID=2528002 RepID=UPI0018D29D6A|nr:hypothetical protein [Posidoniimonas polymericola]